MSPEQKPQIKYPFPICKNCPVAALVIETAKNTNLHPDRFTQLIELHLICAIDNEDPYEIRATIGGMRIDRWISTQKIMGGGLYTERWQEYITKFHSSPPEFCPQLKTDISS